MVLKGILRQSKIPASAAYFTLILLCRHFINRQGYACVTRWQWLWTDLVVFIILKVRFLVVLFAEFSLTIILAFKIRLR